MFSVSNRNYPPSGGLSRRELLRVGALGLSGLTLADLLRHEATAADSEHPTVGAKPKRPKSVIYIVLNGGPSHIDMWDLKPQAPLEYRGPFSPIATKLPGVQICEHMPRQAALLDRATLVRGIRSVENDHYLSEVYTGLPRSAGKRPAFGSIVSRLAPTQLALPSYVSLSETSDLFDYEKPHYAGAGHAPFRPFKESLSDLTPVKNLEQLENRKALLSAFDNLHRELDRRDVSSFGGLDRFQAQALEMIASPKVREAFDLSNESPETLARYGHKAGKYPHQTAKQYMYDWNGKPFLMARRLVEAGVRVVTLHAAEWDHHSSADGDIFFALKCLMPVLDMSLTALVNDLKDRGSRRRRAGCGPRRVRSHPKDHPARPRPRTLGRRRLRPVLRRRSHHGPSHRRNRQPRRTLDQRHNQLPKRDEHDLPHARHRPRNQTPRLQRPAAIPARRPAADSRVGGMRGQ